MATKSPRLIIRLTYEGDDNWQNYIHVQRMMDWAEVGSAQFSVPLYELQVMLRQLTAAVEAGEERT